MYKRHASNYVKLPVMCLQSNFIAICVTRRIRFIQILRQFPLFITLLCVWMRLPYTSNALSDANKLAYNGFCPRKVKHYFAPLLVAPDILPYLSLPFVGWFITGPYSLRDKSAHACICEPSTSKCWFNEVTLKLSHVNFSYFCLYEQH